MQLNRVHLLAAGAFAVGTSAYVVTGVLPQVSTSLRISIAAAGQLTTVFALAYALGAPLLAVLTGRWERRTLLVTGLAVAGLGNLASALVPGFEWLLGARVLAALGAAAYTPAAILMATELSPPQRRGRAVALVFAGLTVALVLGVPAGTVLGGSLGYRGVFAVTAGLCLAAAAAMALVLPRVAAPPPVGLRERLAVAADRPVLGVLAVSVLSLTSVMILFTFSAPLLAASAGATGASLSGLLLVYGLGCVAGNTIGGRLTDRFGNRRPLLGGFAGYVLLLAGLPVTATTLPGAGAALFMVGLAGWSTNAPLQSRLIELAGPNSGLALSLNASAVYVGVGLSGLLGGLLIGWVGLPVLPWVATLLALAALLLLVVLRPAGHKEPVGP